MTLDIPLYSVIICYQFNVDNPDASCYTFKNFICETVEAEITAIMPLQRACGAESQARNKLSNGPLRVQSNVSQ